MLKYVDLLTSVQGSKDILRLPQARLSSDIGAKVATDAALMTDCGQKADCLSDIIQNWGRGKGGIALLDEVDLLLHPLKSELNFPVGNKETLSLAPTRWLLPAHLLDALFYAQTHRITPNGQQSHFGFSADEVSITILRRLETAVHAGAKAQQMSWRPHLVLLDQEYYHVVLRPILAQWALQWILQRKPLLQTIVRAAEKDEEMAEASASTEGAKTTEGSSLCKELPSKVVSLLISYISQDDASRLESGAADFVSGCVGIGEANAGDVASCTADNNNVVSVLNLAADWIRIYLPHILSKINRVNYGLLHVEDRQRWAEQAAEDANSDLHAKAPETENSARWLLAVPFVGKDVPSSAAEFACPEIVIGLSILAYRYEGLRDSDIKRLMRRMKDEMMADSGPFQQRRNRLLLEEWKANATVAKKRDRQQNSRSVTTRGDAGSSSPPVRPLIRTVSSGPLGVAATSLSELQATVGVFASKVEQQSDDNEVLSEEVLSLELFQIEDPRQLQSCKKVLGMLPDMILYYLCSNVFGQVLLHCKSKLSASGVDVGGEMLFGTRLGFSGTPSDLLPPSLLPCHYEKGSDGHIITILSSPAHVTCELLSHWCVRDLLRQVAKNEERTFSALIDTGALITGMSNQEVAKFLLQEGLEGKDCCIYLDSSDRKMVMDRAYGAPTPLERCGIGKERRFTFYDQVHTTGMDIQQAVDAVAAVTIGKDMTLRDYKQGCWRMRGLGKGQRVHVFIVQEVHKLICDAVVTPGKASSEEEAHSLQADVLAWLTLNSIKSEALQQLQLHKQVNKYAVS